MKIFKIQTQVDSFQSLFPVDDSFWEDTRFAFDGRSLFPTWHPIRVVALEPRLIKGDFYHFAPDAFIVGARARELAATPMEIGGEFLSVVCEKREREEYSIFNVTCCVDALDQESCEWESQLPTGERWGINKYVFLPDRLPVSTIFKIPQDVSIYVLEATGDPEDGEFKAIVEKESLLGITFEEVWAS